MKKLILVLLLFLFLLAYYFQGLKNHPLHLDEQAFIRKSYYYDLFFIERNFSDQRWYVQDAYSQPKIGPYIYGLTLHLRGIRDIEKTLNKANFDSQEKTEKNSWWYAYWGKPLSQLPENLSLSRQIILYGRTTSVFFIILAFVFIFKTAAKFRLNPFFPVLATLIISLNDLTFSFSRRAMTDSLQLLAFFINLYLVFVLVEKIRKKEKIPILMAILLGLNCTFGVGVKVSGIMIYLFLLAFFSFSALVNIKKKKICQKLIISFAVLTVIFLSTFYLLHPFIYKSPFQNFVRMFTQRLKSAEDYYWQEFPESAVTTRIQAAGFIFGRTLLPGGNHTNFKLGFLPIDLLFFILGSFFMIRRTVLLLKKREIVPELVFLLWSLVVVCSAILYLRNDWPRYYLPALTVFSVIEVYALAILLNKWLLVVKRSLV